MGALDRKSNPRRVNPPEPSLWETASGHTKAHSQGALTPSYSPPYTSFSLFAASLVHSQASARRDGGGRDATASGNNPNPQYLISVYSGAAGEANSSSARY